MNRSRSGTIVVIGAGPVGCATALAYADRGARVLVIEANPRAAGRLAGEWLHPPALAILRGLGVEPRVTDAHSDGEGFVVFPDDGRPPVVLPYPDGALGLCCEHETLVSLLRGRIEADPRIEYAPFSRVTAIEDQRVTYHGRDETERIVHADVIVGAGGRHSVAHRSLGLSSSSATFSRMAGLILDEVVLPREGFGHVFLGGPGPALAYRLNPTQVRLCLDVPQSRALGADAAADLWDCFQTVLPGPLRAPFAKALRSRKIAWATNQLRPRVNFGREGLALVGDSVGCYHPLTALGMTLGFQDAVALASSRTFEEYRDQRIRRSRVPEMLAVALYEVFADTSSEVLSIRRAIYDLWRDSPEERRRTMGFLAGLDTSPTRFTSALLRTLVRAGRGLVREGLETRRWRQTGDAAGRLAVRARWLLTGTLGRKVADASGTVARTAEDRFGGLLRASKPGTSDALPVMGTPASDRAATALARSTSLQGPGPTDPSPRELADGANRAVRTQNADGGWGCSGTEIPQGLLDCACSHSAQPPGAARQPSNLRCTASALATLAAARADENRASGLAASSRGLLWLRRNQRADGSWADGTGGGPARGSLLGIRGLLAAGLQPFDPRVRRACAWLRAQQLPEGGWGDGAGDPLQTAWALTALLEAQDPDWNCILRGTAQLAALQSDDGDWADLQERDLPIPVRALELFEARRRDRAVLGSGARESTTEPLRQVAWLP